MAITREQHSQGMAAAGVEGGRPGLRPDRRPMARAIAVGDLALLAGGVLTLAALAVVAWSFHAWSRQDAGPRPASAPGVSAPAEAARPVHPRATAVAAPASRAPAPGGALPAIGARADASAVLHTDVFFDVNRTRLSAEAVRVLQETAEVVRGGGWVVLLQGHSDPQGHPEYNRALAQRRAETARQFLVELGVPAPAIRIAAIGPDALLCDDPEPECRRLNRRVHVEMRRLPARPGNDPAARPETVPGSRIFREETPGGSPAAPAASEAAPRHEATG
ncbi:MAG TPA: OmpA family protein [Vicinamibacterales bacterium]|nr:OmpA family protein [Vicinamibacterales bacterium]